MITCPKCEKELNDDAKFCDACGASITEAPAEERPTETSDEKTPTAAPAEENSIVACDGKKKGPKKAIIFGGIGVAAVAVLILVFSLFFGGSKAKNDFALYTKEGEIFSSD